MEIIKRFIAMTPLHLQEELKRHHFRRQIRKNNFITDEPEYGKLDQFVGEGDWVIDIGANVGHYTTRLSQLVGASGRVIAFEPIPTTFRHLAANTQSCRYNNITLINGAVSEKTALAGMSIPTFASGLKNYYQASVSSEMKETDTPVLTLSIDSLHLPQTIRLIKIDAEGHEPVVMRGIRNILQRDKPILIVETVTREIEEQLEPLGYKALNYQGSPNTVFRL